MASRTSWHPSHFQFRMFLDSKPMRSFVESEAPSAHMKKIVRYWQLHTFVGILQSVLTSLVGILGKTISRVSSTMFSE